MNDRPSQRRIERLGRSGLVQLLAPTLGAEKSREVIAEAAKQLRIPEGESLTSEQAEAVLQHLGRVEGIVGVVARFAVGRMSGLLEAVDGDDDEPTGVTLRAPPRPPARDPGTGSYNRLPTVSFAEIAELFTTTLEPARANEVLRAAAAQLGLGAGPYLRAQAVALLDHLAAEEGLVGVVARFSQPRVLAKLSSRG